MTPLICSWIGLILAAIYTVTTGSFVGDGNSILHQMTKSCNNVRDSLYANCLELKRKGHCEKSKKRLELWCPKTCGFCQSNALAPIKCSVTKFGCCDDGVTLAKGPKGQGCPERCVDEENFNCGRYVKAGYCVTHFHAMKRRCPKSCGLCGRGKEGSCFNVLGDKKCNKLYRYGMCDSKEAKKTMHSYCRKSCGQCISDVPDLNEIAPKCSEEGGCCWDKITPLSQGCPVCEDSQSSVFCDRFEPECYSKDKVSSVQMRLLCPKKCGLCNVPSVCKDDIVFGMYCRIWSKKNLCAKEPLKMDLFCKKTCKFCSA